MPSHKSLSSSQFSSTCHQQQVDPQISATAILELDGAFSSSPSSPATFTLCLEKCTKFCTFDSASSVLLVSGIGGGEVPTFDITTDSCSYRISLSADCSVTIMASSYLDGGDLIVDLCLLVAGACVEQ
jgi:hypothetical protein